jgi:aminomuconate-semialdehyde/2-hydroxymuconate-6-semialdehyde dehydrogenase
MAINAAQKAYPSWKSTPLEKRVSLMMRLADLIDENADELAKAESLDNGKPLKLAQRVDIPRASANIRFYAHAITHFHGDSFMMDDGSVNYTSYESLGVVTCISPWNLPLYLFTWKIAPALATGNTIIAKPSEVTPYTAYLFGKLFKEAGFPDGVLNIINGIGTEVGEELVKNPLVKAVSFTGSTRTGKIISESVAGEFKKVSLEMGGKNPNVILADCDYEKMLATTIHSSFSNQGQICLCGSRILIEKSIYDKFIKDFVAKTNKLIVGPPNNPDSKIGAIVSEEHYNKILKHIEIAKNEGGEILCGGKAVMLEGEYSNGYYIAPTIIVNLNQSCRTNQEEIFGPVVTVETFESVEEALTKANGTSYGLSATIWTKDTTKALRLSREIQAGIVWVNCWLKRDLRTPFGGVKSSGVGREGGMDALKFFTEVKNTCISQ